MDFFNYLEKTDKEVIQVFEKYYLKINGEYWANKPKTIIKQPKEIRPPQKKGIIPAFRGLWFYYHSKNKTEEKLEKIGKKFLASQKRCNFSLLTQKQKQELFNVCLKGNEGCVKVLFDNGFVFFITKSRSDVIFLWKKV